MITETSTDRITFTDVLAGEGPPGRMMRQRQSQKDPRRLISLLSTRHTIRIGTWNVRSMYQTGKASSIAEEMRNYSLEILGLSDKRRALGADWSNSNGQASEEEKMGVGRPHAEKTLKQHYEASIALEPTGETKEGSPQE